MDQIASYYNNALALLISQYKDGSPRLKALLEIISDELQESESDIFDLLNKRMLDQGEGAQLDGIGRIVGEPRNGKLDPDYQDALALRIAINTSGGEPEIIIDACRLLLGASKVQYVPLWPANVTVWTLTATDEDLSGEVERIAKIAGAGIGFYLLNNTDSPLVTSDTVGGEDTDGLGLADTGALTTGGEIAEVYHGV